MARSFNPPQLHQLTLSCTSGKHQTNELSHGLNQPFCTQQWSLITSQMSHCLNQIETWFVCVCVCVFFFPTYKYKTFQSMETTEDNRHLQKRYVFTIDSVVSWNEDLQSTNHKIKCTESPWQMKRNTMSQRLKKWLRINHPSGPLVYIANKRILEDSRDFGKIHFRPLLPAKRK